MKLHLKKHVLINIIILLTVFISISCIKEEVGDEEIGMTDNYYVKYVISSSYPSLFSNWSVSTPEGRYIKNGYQSRGWQQTFGPVKKGFKCEVQVQNGAPTIEIYVSINQEPFALKMTNKGNSASYIVGS